jgi:hypothetical protein
MPAAVEPGSVEIVLPRAAGRGAQGVSARTSPLDFDFCSTTRAHRLAKREFASKRDRKTTGI